MKLKLLFLTLLLFGWLNGFAQATAYPVNDINQCGYEIFDLTVNTPLALGNQNPQNFTVTYHESMAAATNNTNAITSPQGYIGGPNQEIYVRVTNTMDNSFDIISFTITVQSISFPSHPNISACDSYALPALANGEYHTGPGGTGTMLMAGDLVTATQTVYIYYQVGECSADDSFTITIGTLFAVAPTPMQACDNDGDGIIIVDLTTKIPEITLGNSGVIVTFHQTNSSAQAGANPIANPSNYVLEIAAPPVLFVRVTNVSGLCQEVYPLVFDDSGCTGNFVSGTVTYDLDNNGCTENDVPASFVAVSYTQGNTYVTTFTDANGNYMLQNMEDGDVEVFVQTSGTVFTAPSPQTITFPGNGENTNFCITAPNPVTDISVSVTPITQARPGFAVSYSLVFQNLGTTQASGNISLTFPTQFMTFTQSAPAMVQSGNALTYNYTNLMPFETRTIVIDFMVMQPPTVNSGTVLPLVASINPVSGDANPSNNTNTLNHIVVNSYDPNDIDVREGEFITMAQAGDYLHYTVRFQNTGDASATFVRVETTLDADLDWNTLQPISSSHDFTTIRQGSALTFKFDDINLAGEQVNEPESHGYVIYRIKPKATAALGDVFSASVNIFFDFNAQVATNVVTTTIVPPMGNKDFKADMFTVYPNPASANVNLQLANTATADVVVTDVLGNTVLHSKLQSADTNLDISNLNSGMYFITVYAEGKSITKKLMVK